MDTYKILREALRNIKKNHMGPYHVIEGKDIKQLDLDGYCSFILRKTELKTLSRMVPQKNVGRKSYKKARE